MQTDVNVTPGLAAGFSPEDAKGYIDQFVSIVSGLGLFMPAKYKDVVQKVLAVLVSLSQQEWFLELVATAVNKVHPTTAADQGFEAAKEAIFESVMKHGEKAYPCPCPEPDEPCPCPDEVK